MATPLASALRFFYGSKYLSSDGGTITQQTATSASTTKTIIATGLTESDNYWDGSVGWFDADTTTAALQGVFFHVRSFLASSDILTLASALPAVPQNTDTFRLVLGGNYRGDIEGFGLTADGDQPEFGTVVGTNITGLTIKKIGGKTGEGTLSVFYDQSAETLQIKMDAGNYGAVLDVTSDVTDGVVFLEDETGYIVVDTVATSLPVGDGTDTFTTAYPTSNFVPNFEGYETGADKTRYRLLVVQNTDGVDTVADLTVWCAKPAGTDTTVATGETITTAAGSADLTDASDHPTGNYWIYSAANSDVRYVKNRSGNTITWLDAGSGMRGFTATAWAATDDVVVYPNFDISSDAPATDQFEDPSTETTAPGAITFSAPMTVDDGLLIGDLATGEIYGVWYRETIVANQKSASNVIFDTLYRWA